MIEDSKKLDLAVIDIRTGDYLDMKCGCVRCVAYIDDEPIEIGGYSARLPLWEAKRASREIWGNFLRQGAGID